MNVSPQIGPAIAASNQGSLIAGAGASGTDDSSNALFASVMADQTGVKAGSANSGNAQSLSGNSASAVGNQVIESVSQSGTQVAPGFGSAQALSNLQGNSFDSISVVKQDTPNESTNMASFVADDSNETKATDPKLVNIPAAPVPDKTLLGKQTPVAQQVAGTGRIIPNDRVDDVNPATDAQPDMQDAAQNQIDLAAVASSSAKETNVSNQQVTGVISTTISSSAKSPNAGSKTEVNAPTDNAAQLAPEDLQIKPANGAGKQTQAATDVSSTEDTDDVSSDPAVGKNGLGKPASRQSSAADATNSTLLPVTTTAPLQTNTVDKTTATDTSKDDSAVSAKEATGKAPVLQGSARTGMHHARKGAGKAELDETTGQDTDFAAEADAATATNATPLKSSVRPVRPAQLKSADRAASQSSPAADAGSQNVAAPVVVPVADKEVAAKSKARSRDAQTSIDSVDDADNSRDSSGVLTATVTSLATNDAVAPSFHSSAMSAGVVAASTKESGTFAVAGSGSATHNIGSSTGATFTPAQNVRMEMGRNGGQQVEVGFHDGTLGWLSVRATAATDGGLHLSMTGRGNETAAAVDRMLPSLQHFLQDHDVRAHSVSFARQESSVAPVATMAMSTSAFSADSSNASQSDRNAANMGQQRSNNSGSGAREFSQQERNTQERSTPPRSSTRYEGLGQEQGLLSIRI